jgi:hypothetical protein
MSKHWHERSLIFVEATIDLTASTIIKGGLKIHGVKENSTYNLGETVTDADFDFSNIERDAFHGEWNYSISKQKPKVI